METGELIELLAELRKEIRAAHEVISDLRAEVRRAEQARKQQLSSDGIDRVIKAHLDRGLKEYSEAIDVAVKEGTDAAYRRFDVITAICMGEDPKSVREGKITLPDLLREFIAVKGLPYRLTKIKDGP